ncbi:MAG: site-2 protease family protein, partial [Clostridia bacterium]|nr:site-2 protease family protein [Clostridia bacterium]
FCQSNTLLSEEQYSALKADGAQTVKDMLYTEKDESGKQNYYFGKQAGENDLRLGDEILSVNGYRSYCFNDAYFAMSLDNDGVMDMEVLRDGKKVNIKKEFIQVPTEFEGTYQTIIDFRVFSIEKTFGTVLEQTWFESLFFVRSVYVSLFRLVTCQSGFNEMSGPVGIATVIGEAAEAGFAESFMTGINNILRIMALITFNLGIFNLLPIPALDGGRLVFLYIEGIRRKPINPKYEGVIHFIGLLLFFALIIAVTFNDVSRLITNCVG